jgi:hypothetical protein
MSGRSTLVALVLIGALGGLAAYYLHLSHNRFSLVAAERGAAYEIDRVTGKTWLLFGGKKTIHTDPTELLEAIPPDELAKITGSATLSSDAFHGELYNGSSVWAVRSIVFRLVVRDSVQSVRWTRDLADNANLDPLSSETFFIKVVGAKNAHGHTWTIESARGFRKTP